MDAAIGVSSGTRKGKGNKAKHPWGAWHSGMRRTSEQMAGQGEKACAKSQGVLQAVQAGVVAIRSWGLHWS